MFSFPNSRDLFLITEAQATQGGHTQFLARNTIAFPDFFDHA